METFEDMQVAVAFCTALRAHNVSTEQLDALRNNDLALQAVAAQIRQLTAPDPVSDGVTTGARTQHYPGFGKEMPARVKNPLEREGITNIGCLQIYTIADLLDIRMLGEKSIDFIQDYLARHNMRLREENESRHDRMRYIYPDATLIPRVHLPESYGLDDEIRTYGDLQRFTRSELIKCKRLQREKYRSHFVGYEYLMNNEPLSEDEELDKIEAELRYFGLSLAPGSE